MRRRRGAPIDGVLLLNKPVGISSNSALQRARVLLGAQKAGHTGSLDPYASGMLPICLGEATKFSQYFLEADKTYQVVMRLGITTTTGDQEGEVVTTDPVPTLTDTDILALFESFMGTSQQIPSMYSAIKHQGKPLYQLARKGKTVPREPRTIQIYALSYQERLAETDIAFEVSCSKGTYIRSLVEDMGQKLGCGAYVVSLHRLHVAPFKAPDMIDFGQLAELEKPERQRHLLPLSEVLSTLFPLHVVPDTKITLLRRGHEIAASGGEPAGCVTLVSEQGQFLGLGEHLAVDRIVPKRLIAQETLLSTPQETHSID